MTLVRKDQYITMTEDGGNVSLQNVDTRGTITQNNINSNSVNPSENVVFQSQLLSRTDRV
jgi:hypothetical protein